METLDEVTPTRLASHKAPPVEYLHLSDRTIAYRHLEGKCPTLIYVGGFLSTMEIHKATTIEQYAKVQGRASIRYDQASVGLSQGITRENAYNEIWVQDCLAMMDIVAAKGPVILIASSNGAQICAYIALIRSEQVKGMVFIGPSIRSRIDKWDLAMEQDVIEKDMLEKFNAGQKIAFKTAYGKGFFCKEFFESDRKIKIHMEKPIPIHCPVKMVHAWNDDEVPYEDSLLFQENVESKDCDVIIRKQGNHRLMKQRDLTLLTYTVHSLLMELELKTQNISSGSISSSKL